MLLNQFDVRGECVTDDVTEEIIVEGDPWRNLVRYRPDGSEFFIAARINMPLLQIAKGLPSVLVKPQPKDGEVGKSDGLLTVEGSIRNFRLLREICEALSNANIPACCIAERHGDGRRDFYFAVEDVPAFERTVRSVSEANAYPVAIEHHLLADVAIDILPREAIGELGLAIPTEVNFRATRFEFWGAYSSLENLQLALERLGYRFVSVETYLRELRMIKTVPIDGSGFDDVLKEIVTLARSLRCSYVGTETIDGHEQFALTRPLPKRYASSKGIRGMLRRMLG